MRYHPRIIGSKWQKQWLKEKIYEPNLKRAGRPTRGEARHERPFYNLMMFPYPSAEGLHVGNMYAFTGSDIYGRMKRMRGYDVFEPIGLDGFGIHSENYALSIGKHPADQAKISEKRFYEQLKVIGNGFAWDEHLETYDPDYYRWTQWIFIQMFKRGLAYRKKSAVNWCLSCKTVLADEQVISGACERCSSKVIKKELEQWFFKITAYAGRLLKNLETIDWSEKIKIAQRNWIGKSEGALLKFQIPNSKFQIEVFTTRPDTLFGATYMVLGPEHPLIKNLKSKIKNCNEVEDYIKKAKAKTEEERIAEGREKTGVELKGIKAINPANNEEIPIWVADYVLGHVGTGAIMAVPAHDERDLEFARRYKLPIPQVIAPHFEDEKSKRQPGYPLVKRKSVYCILRNPKTNEYLTLDWRKFGWHTFIIGGIEEDEDPVRAAKREIIEETGYKNIRFVRKLWRLYGSYFAAHKKENRLADAEGLLFELVDGIQKSVRDHEKNLHTFQWMKPNEVDKFIDISSQKYIWEQLKNESAYTGEGFLVDSGEFSGMESEEAKWKITKFVGGKREIHYRLRDWLISRQRYWGPPIPLVFCENCAVKIKNQKSKIKNTRYSPGELENPGWIAVPEKDLPVTLPYIKKFRPTGTEKSPLALVEKFYKVRCPKCKSWARRETDVSDTFLDSAWYYLRYPSTRSTRSGQVSWDPTVTRKWFPVDMYIGGAEHAVLHLLYVRFLAMAFFDWGLTHFEEPFKKFRAHGLLIKDGAKMSKSRGNVVNPDDYIRAYGADALRMYLMFLGPFEQGGDFRDTGIRGVTRFLERVWRFTQSVILTPSEARGKDLRDPSVVPLKAGLPQDDRGALKCSIHRTIKKVTDDIEDLQYNTAISALMVLLNAFEEQPSAVAEEHISIFLRLLAPFAPHITEELYQQFLGNPKSEIRNPKQIQNPKPKNQKTKFRSIHLEPWPILDPKLIQEDTFELIIQVNGKVRDRAEVEADAGEAEVKEIVLAREKVRQWIGLKPVRKFIYVPGRIVNIVI